MYHASTEHRESARARSASLQACTIAVGSGALNHPLNLFHMALGMQTVVVAGLYALLCKFLYSVSLKWIRTAPFAAKMTAKDHAAFPNRAVATVNALLIGVSGFVYLWPRASIGFGQEGSFVTFAPEDVSGFGWFQALCCDVMLGYIIFDTYYYLFEQVTKLEVDMLVHHLLGLASWLAVRHTAAGGLYLMWTHMAELSTPFLQVSWLLSKLGRQQTLAFYVTSRGTILAFLFFRVISVVLQLFHMYSNGEVAFRTRELGPGLFYAQVGVMATFLCLNVTWLSLLLRMAATDEIREAEEKYTDKRVQKHAEKAQ